MGGFLLAVFHSLGLSAGLIGDFGWVGARVGVVDETVIGVIFLTSTFSLIVMDLAGLMVTIFFRWVLS
jgi:hypothetical protein